MSDRNINNPFDKRTAIVSICSGLSMCPVLLKSKSEITDTVLTILLSPLIAYFALGLIYAAIIIFSVIVAQTDKKLGVDVLEGKTQLLFVRLSEAVLVGYVLYELHKAYGSS